MCPGVQTTIKSKRVHTTTIIYRRIVIIQIGSTILLMGVGKARMGLKGPHTLCFAIVLVEGVCGMLLFW